MSALAMLLKERGARVRGSDAVENDNVRRLKKAGIPVSVGCDEEISEDIVVYTGAVNGDHPQLQAARRAGKRLIARAELLGMTAEAYPCVVSVAGSHGKTSCTAMLSHIFLRGNRKFTCHIGGEDLLLGNYHSSGKDFFITEACEFQRSFLSLKSNVAVILNTDRDHTDCYRSDEELLAAYRQFSENSKQTVVNADDRISFLIPYTSSFGGEGEICAADVESEEERYSFTVVERGEPLARIRLSVVGDMQVQNALAAFAAARLVGFSAEEIKSGLESFHGVRRRFERVGTLNGIPVVCDYAHHPREIDATYSAAERLCRGTVRLVFQPHTYTRTRDFMEDFVSVLKRAENPIIYKTYAAREAYNQAGSAVTLVSRLPEAVYVQSPDQLKRRLLNGNLQPNDLILVLGAGDIYDIAKSILD